MAILKIQNWIKNLREGVSQISASVRNYPAEFKAMSFGQKFSSLAFGAAVITAGIVSAPAAAAGAGALLVHGMGMAAFGGVLLSMRLKENRHLNACQPLVAYTLTAQKMFLGAYGYAVMAALAGTRAIVMSALPDDEQHQSLRKKVAYGFAAVGVVGVGATGVMLSPWNFLPMASTLMGTAASALISKHSRHARVLYFIANCNNAVYSWFFSGSVGATMVDGMAGLNITKAIGMHDIPAATKDGQKLPMAGRLSAYFSSLAGRVPSNLVSSAEYREMVSEMGAEFNVKSSGVDTDGLDTNPVPDEPRAPHSTAPDNSAPYPRQG